MVTSAVVAGERATAERLVKLLRQDGFQLDAAVWVVEDDEHGRLYLVPHVRGKDTLEQTIRVAYTISTHKDELPGRHDLLYSIVGPDHPVIQAVRSVSVREGKVQGVSKDGIYIDTAYVFRTEA